MYGGLLADWEVVGTPLWALAYVHLRQSKTAGSWSRDCDRIVTFRHHDFLAGIDGAMTTAFALFGRVRRRCPSQSSVKISGQPEPPRPPTPSPSTPSSSPRAAGSPCRSRTAGASTPATGWPPRPSTPTARRAPPPTRRRTGSAPSTACPPRSPRTPGGWGWPPPPPMRPRAPARTCG